MPRTLFELETVPADAPENTESRRLGVTMRHVMLWEKTIPGRSLGMVSADARKMRVQFLFELAWVADGQHGTADEYAQANDVWEADELDVSELGGQFFQTLADDGWVPDPEALIDYAGMSSKAAALLVEVLTRIEAAAPALDPTR